MKRTAVLLLLALALLASLCACAREKEPVGPPAEAESDENTSQPTETSEPEAGSEEVPYDPSVVEKLKNGEISAAIIPTNTAARLYNETDGQIVMAAIVRYASANGDDAIKDALGATEKWLASRGGTKYPAWCLAVRSDIEREELSGTLAMLRERAANTEDSDVVCITGQFELLDAATAFLQSLYYMDPASIGGSMPDDAFYMD